ncbi:MAG: phage holin family protein [Eubacteriales bacterium]|nr:phage holin family protein [Eubacteriales bacterium]
MHDFSARYLRPALAVALGGVMWLFGGWDTLLQVLLCVVACDYLSGVIRATKTGELSSSVGFHGLLKKGAILLVVVVAAQLDRLGGLQNDLFRSSAALFYIANEGLSILENLGGMGVPLPKAVTRALLELRDAQQHEQDES